MTALMSVFCQKNVNSLKKHCSHAHILSKNILSKTRRSHVFFFSKIRDLLSCPYFVKKPLFSKKTRRYHVFSLEFFIKNRNTVMPKSGQKNVNSVKTILSYGPKKSKWYPFFPILNEKASLFMPIFRWKNVHCKSGQGLPYWARKKEWKKWCEKFYIS